MGCIRHDAVPDPEGGLEERLVVVLPNQPRLELDGRLHDAHVQRRLRLTPDRLHQLHGRDHPLVHRQARRRALARALAGPKPAVAHALVSDPRDVRLSIEERELPEALPSDAVVVAAVALCVV